MAVEPVVVEHRLLDPVEHRRPNRWLGAGTCQCVCGCGFIALERGPDYLPALCIHCAKRAEAAR